MIGNNSGVLPILPDKKLRRRNRKENIMAHLTPYEINEIMKELREGKEVNCPFCHNGIMKTKHDPKTAYGFQCDKCGKRINSD